MKSLFFWYCLTAILFVIPVYATNTSLGTQAFDSGEYLKAIRIFQAAITEGDTSAATRYNLAVSYFRTDNLEKAKHHFLVLHDPLNPNPRVTYSLGVIEKRLGNLDEAARLFLTVTRLDTPLVGSAAQQLVIMGYVAPVKPNPLQRRVLLGVGHNDAIVNLEDESIVQSGDVYSRIQASVTALQGYESPVEIGVVLTDYRYSEITSQNFSNLRVTARRRQPIGKVNLEMGLAGEWSMLADGGFLSSHSGELGFSANNREQAWKIAYRYRESAPQNHKYQPLRGKQERVEFDYRKRISNNDLFLRMKLSTELAKRPEIERGAYKLNMSRRRKIAELALEHMLNPGWQVSTGVYYMRNEMPDYQRISSTSGFERSDLLRGVRFSMSKKFFGGFDLTAQLTHEYNQSNHSAFRYRQTNLLLGVIFTY